MSLDNVIAVAAAAGRPAWHHQPRSDTAGDLAALLLGRWSASRSSRSALRSSAGWRAMMISTVEGLIDANAAWLHYAAGGRRGGGRRDRRKSCEAARGGAGDLDDLAATTAAQAARPPGNPGSRRTC
jgi:hypothetical protein